MVLGYTLLFAGGIAVGRELFEFTQLNQRRWTPGQIIPTLFPTLPPPTWQGLLYGHTVPGHHRSLVLLNIYVWDLPIEPEQI